MLPQVSDIFFGRAENLLGYEKKKVPKAGAPSQSRDFLHLKSISGDYLASKSKPKAYCIAFITYQFYLLRTTLSTPLIHNHFALDEGI